MKKGLKLLSVATVAALLGIMFTPGSALAAPTCTVSGDTATVQLDTDSTTALRLTGAGNIEYIDGSQAAQNPPSPFNPFAPPCSTGGGEAGDHQGHRQRQGDPAADRQR